MTHSNASIHALLPLTGRQACVALMLFGALSALSGCTVLTDFSECDTDADCAQGICTDGICQVELTCTERADCLDFDPSAYCLAGQCAAIDPQRCGRLGDVFRTDADGVIIPIGALMPLTGTNQIKGEAASDGAELALRQINASGGSTGGKFGLIVCDTGYDPKRAVEQANYLHQELGVQALLGAISSAETLAVVDQVATPNQLLMISPASTSPGLSRRSNYFWRTIPSDAVQAPVMADLLAKRGVERALLLYGGEADPYGNGFFNALTFYWAENPSLKPKQLDILTFDTSNPTANIDAIGKAHFLAATNNKPQAVILIGSLSSSDILARLEADYIQALPAADRPLWVLPEAMRDRTLLEKSGIKPAYDRIIGTSPLRTETPIFETYETLLKVTFNREARDYQFPDKAYDAAYLLALTYGAQLDPLRATGASLNAIMANISSQGPTSNLLGNQYSSIAGALRDGQMVNVVGVSGELDFNDSQEVSDAQIATWIIDVSSGSPEFVEAPSNTDTPQ